MINQSIRVHLTSSCKKADENAVSRMNGFCPEEDLLALIGQDGEEDGSKRYDYCIGTYVYNERGVHIRYDESEEGIFGGTETMLTFTNNHPEKVMLTRSGFLSMGFQFEEGRYCTGDYMVMGSKMPSVCYTTHLDNRILTDKTLDISYDLLLLNNSLAHFDLHYSFELIDDSDD